MEEFIDYELEKINVCLNDNERSFVIQVISEINDYLRDKDISVKHAGGERTINGGSFVKFPDVLLFSDVEQGMILQGWEAKCPDVSITDSAFVADAHKKANLLRCNSCVLWNFQFAELHIKDENGVFQIAKHWVIDPRIQDRDAIHLYEKEWKTCLHDIIDTVNGFINTGRIKHRAISELLTESVMPEIINENKAHVAQELKKRASLDVCIKAKIENWWLSVKKEYSNDEQDPFEAYAKIVLVNWLNKFIFANLIQKQHDAARLIASITTGCKIQEALDYFDAITEKCDYYNVFSDLEYSEILPDETWDDLISFNELILECDLNRLSSEYSHKLLESNISAAKRQIAGQYPTAEPLAKLMCEIAIRNAYGHTWDCCCGTGTIGCAAWTRKVELLTDVDCDSAERAFKTTWMSDIHDFPLQVATQSFASLSLVREPLLVFEKNVFDVKEGDNLFVVDPETGENLKKEIPKFDAIISNLPFVDFNTAEISWYQQTKHSIKEEVSNCYGLELSDRNDLYCYITIYLNKLLANDGVMVILTSNSWLCSDSGRDFMAALRAMYDVDGIYANGSSRWFTNADVMNALIVLKKKGSVVRKGAYFGCINTSVEDLADSDVRNLVSNHIILHDGGVSPYFSESHIDWKEVEHLDNLGVSYYSMCHGLSFLSAFSNVLVCLSSLFEITRGVKSGQDDFFYSDNPGFIDEDYRVNLLKNLKDVETFELKPNAYAFVCKDSIEKLSEKQMSQTLNHIRSVANINNSCKSHTPYWYTLPDSEPLTFATMMNAGDRLFFAGVPKGEKFVANQRAICLRSKDNVDEELALALLNSTLGMLLLEASAAPMALGALDTRASTFKKMYMLDPDCVGNTKRQEILDAFKPLKRRKIDTAMNELQYKDRNHFDEIVLSAYGLEAYLPAIKHALKEMLDARKPQR